MHSSSPIAISATETPQEFVAAHRLALAMLPPARLRAMLEAAGGLPSRALALAGDVLHHPPIALTAKQRERLEEAQKALLSPKILEQAQQGKVCVVLQSDSRYPALLHETSDAPPMLFVRGTLPKGDSETAAIVGSRRAMLYGRDQAIRFARSFAENGVVVVSGGAAGIDTAAHQGAADAGGITIAVLGCGVDVAYPAANRTLFARIAERSGAVISEFPVGTTPEPWRFPTRNRIIAGIAKVTLVIESPSDSGAMITARNAGEYGRDVWAVPGGIDSGRSRGCHKLIQDGAGLADSPADVLATLGITTDAPPTSTTMPRKKEAGFGFGASDAPRASPAPNPKPLPPLSLDEESLLAQMDETPRHLDVVGVAADLTPPRASVAVTLLEMKSLVERRPGNLFVRRA